MDAGAKYEIYPLMGALAELVNTARLAVGFPPAGTMGELDAIAACFIGGTSMLAVGSYWQMILKGSILVWAV